MLKELFTNPSNWVLEIDKYSLYNDPFIGTDGLFRYLYCRVNVDTQWCYLGIHRSTIPVDEDYYGSTHNAHYWHSLQVHDYKLVILGYYSTDSELSKAESELITEEFISKYSENGIFNLTVGGSGTWFHCNTPECREKAMKTNRDNHGGVLAFHTPESYEVNMNNHGGVLAMNTEEACKKSKETNIKLYGPQYAFNNDLAIETKIKKYGSITGFITDESQRKAKETITRLYGDPMGQCHTELARLNRSVTLVLKQVLKTIQYLIESNLELNIDNYKQNCCISNSSRVNHLWKLGQYYDYLSQRAEWTNDIDKLIRSVIQSDQLNDSTSTTIEKQ